MDTSPSPDWCKPNANIRWSALLSEHFRCRHSRADAVELFDSHTVESVLAARRLDGPDDHAPYERGDLLHTLGGRIVPRDGLRGLGSVLNRRRPYRHGSWA